jgi:uncharacterized protein
MQNIQITLPYNHTEQDLQRAVRRKLGPDTEYRILKKSIDARKQSIKVQYSISTDVADPVDDIRALIARQSEQVTKSSRVRPLPRPVVVGTGPAGIFCSMWLHLHGFAPIVLEQGPPMRERIKDMARFMKLGELNPYSNICFGAGGAGTYSDGKLITRIRSPYIAFIMSKFIEFGAPEDIRYLYNPHLGSNKIRQCITALLDDMQTRGVDIRYNTRFTDLSIGDNGAVKSVQSSGDPINDVGGLFIASGHSSRETYALLRQRGIDMESKEFAVGVRVEHSADTINRIQYGHEYKKQYPNIETAQYKLAKSFKEDNRAVYSFCMCPGGYVLNASSDTNGVVTNGMSNYSKSGRFSNAAVVVNVSLPDLERSGFAGVDAGLEFQKEIEEKFRASVNEAGRTNVVPGQRLWDFLQGKQSRKLGATSCLNPVANAPIHTMFPDFVYNALRKGFGNFDHRMNGFTSAKEAQIFGAETRTSSPYRIVRDDDTLVSPSCNNLYPVGEGAGFAGGITSAAVDGIKCAQRYIESVLQD